MTLTVADYFCGAGGSSTGMHQVPGVRVVMASNHWQLAVDTHNANFPDADHDREDITRIDPRRHPSTDIGWFSPECFPAGTTILTRRGLRVIEAVQVGDEVLTHRLRWRRVTAVMARTADTIVVSGYGHTRLETTPEHPFYARPSKASYATRKGGHPHRVPRSFGPADWIAAGDLASGHFWSSPTEFEVTPIPAVRRRGLAQHDDFWWVVGRWLGDGCLRRSRGEVQITCGLHEANTLGARLAGLAPASGARSGDNEIRWTRRDIRTATVFTAAHRGLCEWLLSNFGEHSHDKTMPAWALGMPVEARAPLLKGYTSADGHLNKLAGQRPIMTCSTVSRALAVGIRLLALSLGHKASMSVSSKRTEGVIEGRTVQMRPLWTVQWCVDPSARHNQTLLADGIRWSPVRKVTAGRTGIEVFNLSVEEDESYVADGVIVHNCTNWSVAKGRKVDYDGKPAQLDLFAQDDEPPLPDEAAQRSRMLMQDVPRFTEVHRYRAVIVENVTDVLKWQYLGEWLRRMRLLGYHHRIIVLNSAFATAFGPGAPQLRDRVYFVFWRQSGRVPDFAKWTRPRAWCQRCGDVRAVYVDKKPGTRRTMRYGQQYLYRCPAAACRGAAVAPYALPAATVIDWTVTGQRIGDRTEPLADKTLARIVAGLAKHATAMLTPAGGTWNTEPRPVSEPMRARTTRESEGLLCPPMLVPVEGRDGKQARPVSEPMRAQTARAENALVIPLRNNGVAKQTTRSPLLTFAAGGTHQGLLYGYDTGTLRPLGMPMPAQTTVDGDALLCPRTAAAVDVDGCTFRMLTVDEIRAGMAFTPGYRLLGTSKRANVRMLGNAVTPPAARDLVACVAEAITGDTFDLAA